MLKGKKGLEKVAERERSYRRKIKEKSGKDKEKIVERVEEKPEGKSLLPVLSEFIPLIF